MAPKRRGRKKEDDDDFVEKSVDILKEPPADEDDGVPSPQAGGGKGKGRAKKDKGGGAGGFGALAGSDDDDKAGALADGKPAADDDEEEEEEVAAPAAVPKKKNRRAKNKQKGGFAALDEDGDEEQEEEEGAQPSAGKKGGGFAALTGGDGDDNEDEEEDEPVSSMPSTASRRKQKKNRAKGGFADLGGEDEDEINGEEESAPAKQEEPEEAPVPEATPAPAAPKAKAKAKGKKGKNKKKADDDEDLDAILAEIEGKAKTVEAPAQEGEAPWVGAEVEAPPVLTKSKARQKKKQQQKGEDTEDIDAILAEIEGKPKPEAPTPSPPQPLPQQEEEHPAEEAPKGEAAAAAEVAAEGAKPEETPAASEPLAAPQGKDPIHSAAEEPPAPDAVTEATEETEGTTDGVLDEAAKRALKNKLKKEKKKAKAKAAVSDETEDKIADDPEAAQAAEAAAAPAPAPSAAAADKGKKKKPGPVSAAARAAQERIQAIKEAEEQRKKEEDEVRKKEEERLRKIEEEEARQEEELKKKREKKEAQKVRRQQLKKEGKLLSKAEKQRAERAAEYRRQLEEQGLIQKRPEGESAHTEGPKKTVVVSDRRKKRRPQHDTINGHEEGGEGDVTMADEGKADEAMQPVADETHKDEVEGEEEVDDWEALIDEEDESKKQPPAMAEPSAAPAAPAAGKPAAPARAAKPEQDVHMEEDEEEEESEEEESEEEEDEEEEDESDEDDHRRPMLRAQPVPKAPKVDKATARLRSPICCILGHVDTGKTKLLDKIRRTNVQEGEAGGITQQIGATFFPKEALWEQCKKVDPELELHVPGLLIIDTPGHESFNNLRARGSSLCDIAILVVDIMHGLEPQTLESLGLLKKRKCPFVIALNKIDRMYQWEDIQYTPAKEAIDRQQPSVKDEFKNRVDQSLVALAEQGLNCFVYWDNPDFRRNVSVAPTSAITGEGIPDLLMLLVKLTQDIMTSAIVYKEELQCTILEVKNIEGLGTTIDVILVNGTLHEGDTIIVCGMSGPIVTNIRALLTPQPLKELRVKGEYIHHKQIHAAMGVKISAQGLEDAVAGTSLFVVDPDDEEMIEDLKDEVMADMSDIFKSVDRSGSGVYVMASTLGSLEALLAFLKDSKIPVFCVNIGTVNKIDVKKASVMKEKGHPEFATILAFDVKIDSEARKEAEHLGVRIMWAEIIYHLFDQFTDFMAKFKEDKRKEKSNVAVFPCVLKVLPQFVFNKKDPIVLGVVVEDGILKIGTPLCVPDKENMRIGQVGSIENNKKPVDSARKGMEVAIKIVGDTSVTYGKQFDHTNKLYSRMTRDAIDCLKEHFRDDLNKDDWKLVVALKKVFAIT
ncbi:unnamed protein product [Vitrella brassicaformis CCMP3155]|uniref:Eukaryotic translation initiation factor 5B n=4 Tax=Vitrella brassicaformis TaxID=1169539 RepID=A0A0G4FIB4_VITBC|nr:unnamed protein product [Vitrella brassicaformis CCMP3155]|eukprot:CEM13219.1 unnamed protein product [Vitrella brassicaformis CCMP3155]